MTDQPTWAAVKEVLETRYGATITLCGSRYTNTEVRDDSDWDYLVVLQSHRESHHAEIDAHLHDAGFLLDAGEHYQGAIANHFGSYKRAMVNLLVTSNLDWAKRHHAATHVAKLLNIANKEHRVALFQAVLYGEKHKCV